MKKILIAILCIALTLAFAVACEPTEDAATPTPTPEAPTPTPEASTPTPEASTPTPEAPQVTTANWQYVYENKSDGTFFAFQPEGGFVEGETYAINIEVLCTGAEGDDGYRVRIGAAAGYAGDGSPDSGIVNDNPTLGEDGVVSSVITKLPAWLPRSSRGTVNDIEITQPVTTGGETVTLTLEFTWSSFLVGTLGAADDYWAVLVGDQGSHSFEVISFVDPTTDDEPTILEQSAE